MLKYRPDQPRVPRGQPDGGQWVDEGLSGSDRRRRDEETRIAQARSGGRGRPGGLPEMTPAQQARYAIADAQARQALRQVRDRDPEWKPTPSLTETAEGAIRAREAEAAEASARLRELLRDAVPNTNPDWGVNRLRKETSTLGYRYVGPTRDPGFLLRNPNTGEEVRVMERPLNGPSRTESRQKFVGKQYYRYRKRKDRPWGEPIAIPDKD